MVDTIRLIFIGILTYALASAPQNNPPCQQDNQQCEVKNKENENGQSK